MRPRFLAIALAGLILLQALAHLPLSQLRAEEALPEEILYVPNGKFLKSVLLGFEPLAADLLWIRTISYFGTHYATDRHYQWLAHMIDLITDLDPNFQYPYHFGALILTVEGRQVEETRRLMEKAMNHHPEVWQYPFYLGFAYYFVSHDDAEAAKFFDQAARRPGSPSYLSLLAARLYARGGDDQASLALLRELYRNARDPKMKEEIQKRIEEIQSRGERETG